MKIVERCRPFSHLPGSACILPGSCLEVEAYPTLLRIGNREIKLQLTGPVEGFTLQQDVERGCVWVFGKASEGYYRLRIEAAEDGFYLVADRVPKGGLTTDQGFLKSKASLHFNEEISFVKRKITERLFLGSHKAQDWDQVQKRWDLRELLPLLFYLGQKTPLIPPQPRKGTALLLELPSERKDLDKALCNFFMAAFKKILVPRLQDDDFQGIAENCDGTGNRHVLIQEGAKMVRSLFFQQVDRRLQFLPLLPVSLDTGCMTQVQIGGVGEVDFDWSKKVLRQVSLRAETPGEVLLELQKELKSFRLRTSLREKGRWMKTSEPLDLEASKTYLLDRFQK